jgi:putative selenate reductase molybdopterin-binding subunit
VPFHSRRQVAMILQIPVQRVHVIKPRIGGGFGGKQEMLLEDICGALALATAAPSRLNTPARKSSSWRAAAIRRSCG